VSAISRNRGSTARSITHASASRDGRFLAGLLSQLTDRQLHDIFDVARFTRRDPDTTVDDWVTVFKRKRAEIVNRRCAASPPRQDDDAAAMQHFGEAVEAYTVLRQQAARTVPAVEVSADAASIRHATDTLALTIRAARPTAEVGNTFSPDVAAALTTRIRHWLADSGYTAHALLAEINEDSQGSHATAAVNGAFPWVRGSAMPYSS
jgi:hypothetical protein